MSERDKIEYWKIKSDPVRYAAYLDRKRRERKAKQLDRNYETERKRRWRAANPGKADLLRRANHAVEFAISHGQMIRPTACTRCGAGGLVEGHHPSYARDQWLVVVWLCVRCHALEHHPRKIA